MGTVENTPYGKLDWSPVDNAVKKFAPKFWGIDTGSSLIPLPQTADYKLNYLRKTLALAPNLNRTTQSWVDVKRQKTVAGIEKFLKQAIVLPTETPNIFDGVPITHQQAFRIKEIGDRLHSWMGELQSPIEYVFSRYAGYAENNADYIPEPANRIGHVALELFMFAAGGDEFARKIQETTSEFYIQRLPEVPTPAVNLDVLNLKLTHAEL